jgi:hypothetical protein
MKTYVALALNAGLSTSPTLLQRTSPQLQQELAEQLSLPFIPCNELLLQVDNKAKHPSSSPSQKILFATPKLTSAGSRRLLLTSSPYPRPSAAIERAFPRVIIVQFTKVSRGEQAVCLSDD